MSHVFISYVRADTPAVDRLVFNLRSAGIEVWVDRQDIPAGARWKDSIREAIRTGAFFIACFSKSYLGRTRTYMNEELALAIEELRLRPRNRSWFLPVSLDGSEMPEFPIGPGEMLGDLQSTRLDESWEDGIGRLITAIAPYSSTLGAVQSGLALQAALKSIATRGSAASHLLDDLLKIRRTTPLDDETLDQLGVALLSVTSDARAISDVLAWEELPRLNQSLARLELSGDALLPALEELTAKYSGSNSFTNAFAFISGNDNDFRAFANYSLKGFDQLLARYDATRDERGYPVRIHPTWLLYVLGLVARVMGHRSASAPLLDVGEQLLAKVIKAGDHYSSLLTNSALEVAAVIPTPQMIQAVQAFASPNSGHRTRAIAALELLGEHQDMPALVEMARSGDLGWFEDLVFGVTLARRGERDAVIPLAAKYPKVADRLADLRLPDELTLLKPISVRLRADWNARAQLFSDLFYKIMIPGTTYAVNVLSGNDPANWDRYIWD